ncbi:hypothetical protein SIM91_01390 [Rhodococcus opacus]|nr:hypothetical protein [Rhodococcus opacus]MDX5962003.1 hypothetical protein [Rhodococcus opacus]
MTLAVTLTLGAIIGVLLGLLGGGGSILAVRPWSTVSGSTSTRRYRSR